MTPLDRLAALEEKASPGPWEASKGHAQSWDAMAGGNVGAGRWYWRVTAYDPKSDECWEVPAWSQCSQEHDAKFIATLRNAAEELIAVARAAEFWARQEVLEHPSHPKKAALDALDRKLPGGGT